MKNKKKEASETTREEIFWRVLLVLTILFLIL